MMNTLILESNKALIKEKIINNITIVDEKQKETYTYITYAILYSIEALRNNDSLIIKHYLHWMHSTLSHDGIDESTLKTIFEHLKSSFLALENASQKIFNFEYDDVLNIQTIYGSTHLNKDAKIYLGLILDRKRHEAADYIKGLLQKGYEIPEIYNDIMTPVLYEVGWLWQQNKITTADEHLATAITQYVMTTLYEQIFSSRKNKKKVLGAAIGSELHEIGMRMIIDMFEYIGYNTHYLGGNMPSEAFVSHVKKYQPDIILISVTLSLYLRDLYETIQAIKKDPALKHIKILVGGQPFIQNPKLYQSYDADGYAKNAKDAIKVGESLVK